MEIISKRKAAIIEDGNTQRLTLTDELRRIGARDGVNVTIEEYEKDGLRKRRIVIEK